MPTRDDPTQNRMRETLLSLDEALVHLLKQLKGIPRVAQDAFTPWETTCAALREQLSQETVRIAVVGAIKSGKSTLVNALLKGDYLKRGAGVVTAIVTRIRPGKRLRARLHFKSWEDVNNDIRQALVLFPPDLRPADGENLDIRQKEIRDGLEKALASLDSEHLISAETRNVHSVVLSSYLEGYSKVYAMLSSSGSVREFFDAEFEKHRTFVSDESLAVYLKDVSLEIPTERFGSDIEIADCQGSDAPNPLHLAMIQDYLASTHLTLYVVSSRTGIRQADIKFLLMMKQMGILDNTLFVANCDLNEHDSLENLTGVTEKIRNDIRAIRPDPEIFAFSALFDLFSSQKGALSEKDRARMLQWQKEDTLVSFSDTQARQFESALFQLIHEGRSRLLLKNHVERLWIVSSGILRWIGIMETAVTQDTSNVHEIIEKLSQHQKRAEQIKGVIQTTLEGAVSKMKAELKADIDGFFDTGATGVIRRILKFIRDWEPAYEAYRDVLERDGFSESLYRIFSDFKEGLDGFIAETINPLVIRLIKESEKKIINHFEGISNPYEELVNDILEEYNRGMAALGIPASVEPRYGSIKVDMDWIRKGAGIRLPQNEIALRYSTKIRSDAILYFGLFSFAGWIAKLLRQKAPDGAANGVRSLRKGVIRMKRETERTVSAHFKDYRENIKFQYLFKLSEAVSRYLLDALGQRLQDYGATLALLGQTVDGEREDRSRTLETLRASKARSIEIRDRILQIRENIESISQ